MFEVAISAALGSLIAPIASFAHAGDSTTSVRASENLSTASGKIISGKVIAFIPNEIGQALIHQSHYRRQLEALMCAKCATRAMRNLIVLFMLTLAAALPAQAGRTCQEAKRDPVTVQKALQLALHAREALDASGAEIALVGRVGRDMSKHGLRYSHMAFALRDHPTGRWYLTHMLNQCGTDVSALYDEGLGNFFLDDVFTFDFDDHTPEEMRTRRYQAVTVESVIRFVEQAGSVMKIQVVQLS